MFAAAAAVCGSREATSATLGFCMQKVQRKVQKSTEKSTEKSRENSSQRENR